MNWKEQAANAVKKGTNWAAQIKRLVRPGWGLSPKHARRLYTGVAIPRFLYGVDVWALPTERKGEDESTTGNRHAVNRLASVQRPGALAIVGGLRTSPTDSLCAHANIIPMNLEVEKQCGRAALRMATLPGQHPLTKIARKCARRKVKKHKSPLHLLENTYEMDPGKYESIPIATRNPARIGKEPFKLHILSSKEESKKEVAQAPEHIKIYTDGSAHDGKVGAAAIMIKDGKNMGKLRYHLGKDSEHTVFEAELVGILLGLQLIKDSRQSNLTYTIGVDNQAAIKSLTSMMDKPGHYLAAEILDTTLRLKKSMGKKYSLSIRWTAGHSGIEGNEKADEEAKAAAGGKTLDNAQLPKMLRKPLKVSRSAARQRLNKQIKEEWIKTWKASPRYGKMKHIDSSLPSRKFVELISTPDIHRESASKIFQLRTGHIPLNAYLHRFKLAESAQCPACGAPKETPQHFVLECPAYEYERKRTLKPKKGRLELKYAEIVGRKGEAVALAHYILDTKRFAQDTQKLLEKQAESAKKQGKLRAENPPRSGRN